MAGLEVESVSPVFSIPGVYSWPGSTTLNPSVSLMRFAAQVWGETKKANACRACFQRYCQALLGKVGNKSPLVKGHETLPMLA